MWGSRQGVCLTAPCSRPGSYWHLSQDLALGLKRWLQTLAVLFRSVAVVC